LLKASSHFSPNFFARFFTPYRDFLSLPDVGTTLIIAFLSRMPIGIVGLLKQANLRVGQRPMVTRVAPGADC